MKSQDRAIAWLHEARQKFQDGMPSQADELVRRALEVLDRPLDKTWTAEEILSREG